MRAAVLHEVGGVPRFEEFPDPVAADGEVLVEVKAVALENVDRAVAAGTHYAAPDLLPHLPAVVGFDGVGALADGTLVGFATPRPPYGAMAERTVVPVDHVVPIADGLDPAVAVVIASALTGFAIQSAAGFQPGETVLINGATGVAGRLSVQVARLLGAGRIIATGRDPDSLVAVRELGADVTIDTAVSDDELLAAFEREATTGYDVILDFLWGRPTEILVRSLVPKALTFPRPVRLVQVGQAAGPTISLAAESLRTSGLEILGAIKGMTPESMTEAYGRVVEWARAGSVVFEIERVPLSDIETAWSRTDLHGRRMVVIP